MSQIQYYYFYNQKIYKKSNVFPILEPTDDYTECGMSSYDEACFILQECQEQLAKNSLSFNEDFIIENGNILDNVEVMPFNKMFLSKLNMKHTNSFYKIETDFTENINVH